jgi:hypothetical protein
VFSLRDMTTTLPNTNAAVGAGVIPGTSPHPARRRSLLKNTADAQILRQLNTDRGNKKTILGQHKIATYISKAASLRSPLVLASSKKVACAAERAGYLVQYVPGFDIEPDFMESILDTMQWYNGVFVLLTKGDVFNWAAYKVAGRISFPLFSQNNGFIGLLDGETCNADRHAVKNALNKAVEVFLVRAEHNAVRMLEGFLPQLASIPDLLSLLARFAASTKPSFCDDLIQRCIIPHGLDVRGFRKLYRQARLEAKAKKLEQAMKVVLCS